MNPYQNKNKNEYEILDAVPGNINTSNRYPFVSTPDIAMFDGISPSSIGLGTILSLFLDYKSLLGSPSISGGIGFLQSIIGLITGANLATVTIDDVQRLINQSLDTYTRQQAESRMDSITSNYNQYLLNLRDYINGRTHRDNFVPSLRANEQRLRNELDSFFSLRGRELLLLPNFVQVALLHLSILRDAVVYGGPDLERPFVSETAQTPFLIRPPSSSFREALLTSIRIYTNYCTREYHNGLNQMRNRGNSGRDWLNFNAYRRELTLSVLDFLALFPFFDETRYGVSRNGSFPVNLQLSRVIYTDPAGFLNANGREGWYAPRHNNTVTFSSIENDIPIPTTSRFLQAIDIFTNGLGVGANPNRTQSWQGNINSSLNNSRDNFGSNNGQPRIISGQNIFRVNSTVHTLDLRSFGVSGADFLHTNGQTSQYRVQLFPPSGVGVHHGTLSRFLPGTNTSVPTENNFTHILSRVANITAGLQPVVQGQRNSVVIHGWTHRSLTREDILAPDTITQIPAVKARSISNCNVVSGPGFTGGDLVRINVNGLLIFRITRGIGMPSYRIRLRYVCSGNSALLEVTSGGVPQTIVLRSTTNNSSGNFVYEDFDYVVAPLTLSTGVVLERDLVIRNIGSNSNVFIDKIEYIPGSMFLNRSVEKSNQNIENMYQTSYYNDNPNSSDTYDNEYNPNTSDSYYQSYKNNSNPNYGCNGNQEYDNYNQDYYNNYKQNSGCTCNQGYNSKKLYTYKYLP
ncbi:hypothetical protein IGM_02183 [Bacillus cereus HuB4-4]|uniref:Crystaline entomocidal protoxin n=1 Tax=Bacillus cereus HuB4-4 TaxID=1053211 RepID=A0A9W5QW69_BACCE|nr:insecticidal delta-endotoxin Cry8Ea1 family protein [Bacillus cereus]EOP90491.1 hypothetical protein IGM_02183 [Bacillus cereus HuB4-4]